MAKRPYKIKAGAFNAIGSIMQQFQMYPQSVAFKNVHHFAKHCLYKFSMSIRGETPYSKSET